MNKESMKKVEEFKKEFGMQELTVDDLDNVGGGAGIGLNTQDSISSFCQLVDVLIITEGLEEAVKGYTEGLELSKKCYEILTKNEELVVKKMTEAGLEDFKSEN